MLKGTALKAIEMIVVLAVPAIGGDRRCADCHPKEVQGYRQSAMAHSLSEVTPQPEGSFEHALSKTRFSIRSNPSGVLQLDPLLQQAVELLSSLYRDQDESAKAAGLMAQYRREMGFAPAR